MSAHCAQGKLRGPGTGCRRCGICDAIGALQITRVANMKDTLARRGRAKLVPWREGSGCVVAEGVVRTGGQCFRGDRTRVGKAGSSFRPGPQGSGVWFVGPGADLCHTPAVQARDHSRCPRHWRCGCRESSWSQISAGEAARGPETRAAACEAAWLCPLQQHKTRRTEGQVAFVSPGSPAHACAAPCHLGLQLPRFPARGPAPAARKWSSVACQPPLRGGGQAAGLGRRRELGARCRRTEPEMASAGGGDCEGEGAAPEADRPHQRPFLIGVSGGTASGKVRGWAARRGLPRQLDPFPGTPGGPARPPSREETPAPGRGGAGRPPPYPLARALVVPMSVPPLPVPRSPPVKSISTCRWLAGQPLGGW